LNVYGLCGEAVKRLRGELSRDAIEKRGGPSTKQLGRIENSATVPTSPMLAKLAKAHNLSFEEYLKKLLKASEDIESEKINAFKKTKK
jgi:transcriptional regulator with XRE-family HTH domain